MVWIYNEFVIDLIDSNIIWIVVKYIVFGLLNKFINKEISISMELKIWFKKRNYKNRLGVDT